MRLVFLISVVLLPCSVFGIGRTQSVGVKGKMLCNDKPASNVLVKVYEEDKLTMDEKMAEGETDSDGYIEIYGSADEISGIEPKFNIYHDCDDGLMPCQRKITIYIPNSYISVGNRPAKFYDFGVMQLAGKAQGEERDCIH